MGLISYSRKEWEAWRDNRVINSYATGSVRTCTWCKRVYEEVLPKFGQVWEPTCFTCHYKFFPWHDYRTYDGVIVHRKEHNEYWDRITGGKVPPVEVHRE